MAGHEAWKWKGQKMKSKTKKIGYNNLSVVW